MILDKLRSATRSTHEQLEKDISPIITDLKTDASYAALLRVFYGFYGPLQNAIDKELDAAWLPDRTERRTPAWIMEDLLYLRENMENIGLDRETPAIGSNAAAFGALYVMEGSTLGGKMICKTLSGNLGLEPPHGLSFFYGYGHNTGARWKDFLIALDRFSDSPEETTVIDTANNVFLAFGNWIKKHYQVTENSMLNEYSTSKA